MEIRDRNLTLTRYESFLRIAEKKQKKSGFYPYSQKELTAFLTSYSEGVARGLKKQVRGRKPKPRNERNIIRSLAYLLNENHTDASVV